MLMPARLCPQWGLMAKCLCETALLRVCLVAVVQHCAALVVQEVAVQSQVGSIVVDHLDPEKVSVHSAVAARSLVVLVERVFESVL